MPESAAPSISPQTNLQVIVFFWPQPNFLTIKMLPLEEIVGHP
jgi:hypothetical protein